jgi:hypothetical protein
MYIGKVLDIWEARRYETIIRKSIERNTWSPLNSKIFYIYIYIFCWIHISKTIWKLMHEKLIFKLEMMILVSVQFLLKKATKLNFFLKKNWNWFKPTSFGLVFFTKPVWLGFFGFGSVFSGLGLVRLVFSVSDL